MIDLQQLRVIAQLIDNMEITSKNLEKSYRNNNAEDYNKSKKGILDIQKQISDQIK